jgi:hypothetical protein
MQASKKLVAIWSNSATGSLEMMRVTRRRHSVINCVALHGGEFHSTI